MNEWPKYSPGDYSEWEWSDLPGTHWPDSAASAANAILSSEPNHCNGLLGTEWVTYRGVKFNYYEKCPPALFLSREKFSVWGVFCVDEKPRRTGCLRILFFDHEDKLVSCWTEHDLAGLAAAADYLESL